MTRAQYYLLVIVGAVALVAYARSEQIARRLNMPSLIPSGNGGASASVHPSGVV